MFINHIIKSLYKMSKIDLAQYGIKDVKEVIYNPSYDELFKAETRPTLEGFEKAL